MGPTELAAFRAKLRDRFHRVRLGVLVALGGFNEPELVLLLDRAAVEAWIRSTDRARWLTDRIARTALRQAD